MVSKSMERLNPQNSQAQLWLGHWWGERCCRVKLHKSITPVLVPRGFTARSSDTCFQSTVAQKKNKGLFTWRWETPSRWGNLLQTERIYEVHIMIWTAKFKNWFDAQRAYRVMVHAGSLENKRRRNLNQLPKCIYNSIYAHITWTNSFIT